MPTTGNGMYYEEAGSGPTTLVLLPGLVCSIACWAEVAPRLGGYRTIAMDLPGHAGSVGADADGADLASLAAPVLEACDELGLERFAVVGLSLGGAIGVRIALDRPDQVGAAMAFMPWPAGGTRPGDPVIGGMHDAYGDEAAIARGIEAIALKPGVAADVVRTMLTIPERLWRGWLGGGVYTSVAAELPGLSVPTCYVLGGRDAVAPQEQLTDDVRAMPGGRMVFLSEAGHLAPYEHPALVAQEIREFVGRHAPPSGR